MLHLDWIKNINDTIDAISGHFDFHRKVQEAALSCAKGKKPIRKAWIDVLSQILHNWHAMMKMTECEAVDYMMEVCCHSADNSAFWFLQTEQCKKLESDRLYGERLYYVTIAIFETLNYRCWYEAPVSITFDRDELVSTLRYGKICIDWNAYKKL